MTAGLTGAALKLYQAVALRAADPKVQVSLLTSLARTVSASGKDVEAVRQFLQAHSVKECRG